jgi:TonB family protein
MSTIEGLSVHGYRHSTTIRLNPPIINEEPIGNGTQPITFTNEYWFSDRLQMSVMMKTEQAGGQTSSTTLTQVSLNEPDEVLFQVPSDYKLANVQHAVQIGGKVPEANLITRSEPTYPPLAKAARIQGTVEFTATIGPDGVIKNLQLVRGHPLLVNAAKEAVLQWKYRPTLLNGDPAAVIAPVLVNFTLPEEN